MRTGTVATIDNRNWELRDHREPVQRFSQSRAIALDMESATVAANGFRFRVPYGTLLCVSDKPLHGELKLPGMASEFYRRQVGQHLEIGIRAMEKLRAMATERPLHKLLVQVRSSNMQSDSKRLSRFRASPAADWAIEDVAALCRELAIRCTPRKLVQFIDRVLETRK